MDLPSKGIRIMINLFKYGFVNSGTTPLATYLLLAILIIISRSSFALVDHTGITTGCASAGCHSATKPPLSHHVTLITCESCHRYPFWLAVAMNHSAIGSTLCKTCHITGGIAISPSAAAVHLNIGSQDCSNCHNTTTFLGAISPDVIPPVITVPPDVVMLNTSGISGTVVDLGVAIAVDGRDGFVRVNPDNLGPFSDGITLVKWTAVDRSGNIGLSTQRVIINTPSSVSGVLTDGETQITINGQSNNTLSQVSIVPNTTRVPGVDFNITNNQGSIGLISYSSTTDPVTATATNAFIFNSVLSPNIVPFKIIIQPPNSVVSTPLEVQGANSSWTRSDTATQTIFTITINDNGAFDMNPTVGLVDDPFTIGAIFNYPPIPDGSATPVEVPCSFMGCEVTLDGSSSYDPDDTVNVSDIVSYSWYENYGNSSLENHLGTGMMLPITLSLGNHTITLVIVDTVGHKESMSFDVLIEPSSLSLLEIEKLKIKNGSLKIVGKIALPIERTPLDVNSNGYITVHLGDGNQIVDMPVTFTVDGENLRRWKYQGVNTSGQKDQWHIDWSGASIRMVADGIRISSEHLGSQTSSLEINQFDTSLPYNIVIEEIILHKNIQGQFVISPSDLAYEIEDEELEIMISKPLLPTTAIMINNANYLLEPFYSHSIGRFKAIVSINDILNQLITEPQDITIRISLGVEGFSKEITILSDQLRIDNNKVKYKYSN